MAPIHVVVVAYGPVDGLQGCLEGLGGAFTATVVDNGSDPDARAVCEAVGAHYIDAGRNLGFAAAVNVALGTIDLSRHDVLLLNPDASIAPADVNRLGEALQADPSVACTAPSQHRPGASGHATVCWPFPTPGGAWLEALGFGRFLSRYDYLIASILLVRGAALLDVGGFDEGFFLYAEEADWERRAHGRGWTVRYCPDIEALHVGAGTEDDSDRRQLRFHAGVERHVRKWHGPVGWNSYRAATVLTALRRAVVARGPARTRSVELARLYAAGPYRLAVRSGAIPVVDHHIPEFGPARP